jgi:cell division initiation protein
MMTPQDIREKGFEKAVFGGYDAAAVDDFLENVAADYAAACKENSILKSKMKILVDKIEEYRATEDAMRLALLSAQKLGTQIQNEAKENAEHMVSEAQTKADSILGSAMREVKGEQARLLEAKRASAAFIENMRSICNRQMEFLDKLGEMKADDMPAAAAPTPVPGPEPVEEPTVAFRPAPADNRLEDAVKSIETSVESEAAAPAPTIDFDAEAGAAADDDPTRLYNFSHDAETRTSPRTQFNFETLTFEGKN